MKIGRLVMVLALATVVATAATPTEKDFYELRAQRDKAVAQAMKPINDRYRTSLEALSKRATQAGDLDTALLIKQELESFDAGGSLQLSKRTFENTVWYWLYPKTSHPWKFLPDGRIVADDGSTNYGWRIAGNDRFIITAGGKDWWTFKMDFEEMEGRGGRIGDEDANMRVKFRGRLTK